MHALLLLAALAAPADGAVVRAGTIAFTAEQVFHRARELRDQGTPFTPDQLVDGLAAEAALAAEARKTKLEADPGAAALLAYGRMRLLADLYIRRVARLPEPTEAEARAAFHQRADTARLQSVVVVTKEEADAVRARLEKGADIAAEALRSLEPGAAARQGDTGVLARIVMDEPLATAVFAARRGGLVGPLKTANGWMVARVVATTVGTEAEFASAREKIDSLLRTKLAEQARTHAIEQLKKSARVSIDEPFLRAVSSRKDGAKADASHVTLTVDGRAFQFREVQPALRGVSTQGHGGAAMAVGAIDGFASEFLLATDVRRRGLDKEPDVAAALVRADDHLLAEFAAQRLLAELAGKLSGKRLEAAFAARLEELKRRHDVQIDRPAALAAASRTR